MTRTTRHNRTAHALLKPAAAMLTGALLLTGCTGEDPPPEEPEPSAAVSPAPTPEEASPSASPESSEPEMPERPAAMDRDDVEGAAAAAEYILSLYPYIMLTGDTSEFEAMSHRACGFCDDALRQSQRISDEGATWTGGEIESIELVKQYDQDPATSIHPLDLNVQQSAATIIDAGGDLVFEGTEESLELRVEMAMGADGWVAVEIADRP